ncbi:heme exporter protein CcmB [Candidatus Enterovibrio escicola]
MIRHELLIAYRRQSDILNPLWFFIIVITLFPLGVGSGSKLLADIAPSIIWVAALLATVVSLERLFRDDFSDGSLEQMLLMPSPLPVLAFAKILAHWLLTGLPLLIISPLLAVLLSLDWLSYKAVVITLLLGTPTLNFMGAIGVALTVRLRNGGVLLSLLVLPLFIPVLIFATSAIDMASHGFSINGQLAILTAMLVGSATLSPFAVSAALRASVQ